MAIARFEIPLIVGAWAALSAVPAAADSFDDLGDIPNGFGTTRAIAISADGGVVAGYAYDMTETPVAVRWTPSGGIEALGYSPGAIYSRADGISADGSTIVGVSGAAFQAEAFRWTASGGMQGLGFLPGGSASEAFDASGDGSVVVGWSNAGGAFRWSEANGMAALGGLPGSTNSTAYGVSDDGAVVVGVSQSMTFNPFPQFQQEAFRWTETGGMVGLGDLAGGHDSIAYDVSGNGQVVVGAANNGSDHEAFRWTQTGGMQGLGFASPGGFDSVALGVNYNGSVIVGSDNGGATVWTQANGTRHVADVLTAHGVDMSGWELQSAQGVSADGEIVVGIADQTSGPSGNIEAWIARLDLGIVTLGDLRASLGSIAGIAQSAQQNQSAHLSDLINLATSYGALDAPGTWSAWGGVSVARYDILKVDPEAVEGDVGLTYQLTPAWRLGAGVRWGRRDDALPVFGGENDSAHFGLSLFGAYEPSPHGLRIYGALGANWTDNDVKRGYLNGSTPVSSHGDADGFSYGAAVRVGWAVPLNEHIAVTPFAAYEFSRTNLAAYTETTGPFPASFNEAHGNLDIARAGLQLDMQSGKDLRFWLAGDGAVRRQHELMGMSGEIAALDLPFALEGAAIDREWWEARLGGEWRASQSIRLRLEVNASTDGDSAAHSGARISAIAAF